MEPVEKVYIPATVMAHQADRTNAAPFLLLTPTSQLAPWAAGSTAATYQPTAVVTNTPPPPPIPTSTSLPIISGPIGPANIQVETLGPSFSDYREALLIQHQSLGQVYVLDELSAETPLWISWIDDNSQFAYIRHLDQFGNIVQKTAGMNPAINDILLAQEAVVSQPGLKRQLLPLNSGDFFRPYAEFERPVTVEIVDDDGHRQVLQILFSQHNYVSGYTGPLTLTGAPGDITLGIDWRSEQYAPQGAYASLINSQPELWQRITIAIAGRAPLTWSAIQQDKALLHRELTAAAVGAAVDFYYQTADGRSQHLGQVEVPYYTRFEIVHSPLQEGQFFTIRAGRDSRVTDQMLQEMGDIIRHMFSNRPLFLAKLAEAKAVHSVAPGKDLAVLPEIAALPHDVLAEILDKSEFGEVTGLSLVEDKPGISVSSAHFFQNEAGLKGMTLMHEMVHQMQLLVYEPAWKGELDDYYQGYMAIPNSYRIPISSYFETTPWEWDAYLTPIWFASDSALYQDIEPYYDLIIADDGTTIEDYLQKHWGNPLPAYDGD